MSDDSEYTLATIDMKSDHTGSWEPIIGQELTELLNHKFKDNKDSKEAVKNSAINILSQCCSPNSVPQQTTGLIVGYVQSGKTLSFTTVAAAANDNKFRIIILLAGTINNLADQNKGRLLKELNLRGPFRPWRHIHNPQENDTHTISQLLEEWGTTKGHKSTLLITVLKHANKEQGRINALADVLSNFDSDKLGAALIIDDEADQASLNSLVRKGKHSATHRAILRLRKSLPKHTYLQYTATPQANIFIPYIDLLSPDFAVVLEPGPGYVGGKRIFRHRDPDIVRTIKDEDISNSVHEEAIPPSLEDALRLFIIGVAEGLHQFYELNQTPNPSNRSMMVHPSRLLDDHEKCAVKIRATLSNWQKLLEDKNDPGRDFLLQQFEKSYKDLETTYSRLPKFKDIIGLIADSILKTGVCAVNSNAKISWEDEWPQRYPWILVGGQKLDRGFTVEGLTVTYMPRGKGVGYADTIQQRARFFGYKNDYLGLCRIYLESDVHHAFEAYVESEESMRGFLHREGSNGRLKEPSLIRRFQMDEDLKPTRKSILLDEPEREIAPKSGWFSQDKPHADLITSSANANVINNYISTSGLDCKTANKSTSWLLQPKNAKDTHIHEIACDIKLSQLYDKVLVNIVMTDFNDIERWQHALALIEHAIDQNSNLVASIIKMRPNELTRRGTNKNGAINKIPSGAYPTTQHNRGSVYKGDNAVHAGHVTLQLHTLEIYEGKVVKAKPAKWTNVSAIRLWIHPEHRKTYISQDQSI